MYALNIPAVLLMLLLATPAFAQHEAFVVHNAVVYTADPELPRAEAFAIADGRIVMVGDAATVLAAHPTLHRIDAGGRAVIPGLIDAHAHLMGLGLSMMNADLAGARSVEEIIARLRSHEATLPEGAWLLGRGWDQNLWPTREFPTRQDLDAAFPDRPVWLTRVDGHAAWGNTAALRTAGRNLLDAHVADPEGGRILREDDGSPTGVFIDTAMRFVGQAVPQVSPDDRRRALRLAIGETSRFGLTGIHDAGIDLETIALYRRAIDEDDFNLRVYGMIGGAGETLNYFCQNEPILDYGDRLTVRSIKLYIDGALGSRGAALLEDYADDPGNDGLLMLAEAEYRAIVERAMGCGLQVNTHAIGDRGNRVVLDAYEAAGARQGGNDGRHRIEHAQVVELSDIPRFAQQGVIASMQPIHATSDMYWAEDRVGAERARGAYAWRKMLDEGVRLAFGSDFPVEPVNPLLGFFAALTRQDAEGWPEGGWFPDQALSRAETLHAFTLGAAYAAFQEEVTGSISVGKWADFVILSRDIMQVPVEEILETEVAATFVGGTKVFGY
jgi:predicted amidohydrolase YtcJ